MEKPKFNPLSLAKIAFKPSNCKNLTTLSKQLFKFFKEDPTVQATGLDILENKKLLFYGVDYKNEKDTTPNLKVHLGFRGEWIIVLQASEYVKPDNSEEITLDTIIERKISPPGKKFEEEINQASETNGPIPDHILDRGHFGTLEKADINNQFAQQTGYFFRQKKGPGGKYPTTIGAMLQSALNRVNKLGTFLDGTPYSTGVIMSFNDELFVEEGLLTSTEYNQWLAGPHQDISWKSKNKDVSIIQL